MCWGSPGWCCKDYQVLNSSTSVRNRRICGLPRLGCQSCRAQRSQDHSQRTAEKYLRAFQGRKLRHKMLKELRIILKSGKAEVKERGPVCFSSFLEVSIPEFSSSSLIFSRSHIYRLIRGVVSQASLCAFRPRQRCRCSNLFYFQAKVIQNARHPLIPLRCRPQGL